MRLIAQIVSVLFHPLLMTTYLFTLLLITCPTMFQPVQSGRALLGLIALMTFVLPALNFLFFRLSGTIRNLHLPVRRERLLPFTLISLLYALVTWMFHWKLPIGNVVELMLIITAMVITATVATFFFKISIHSLAAAGMAGILLPLIKAEGGDTLLVPACGVIVIAGLVMSARLYLQVHTPREVMAGSLMGVTIGFAGMIMLF